MAQQLDEMPEQEHSGGREPKYPWGEWLNGEPWMITSEDWDCKNARSFRSAAVGAARRRGGKVQTRMPDGATGDVCVIRFVPSENGSK